MDMDLDLDDVGVQPSASEKVSRFQPKGSKFKPKPKQEGSKSGDPNNSSRPEKEEGEQPQPLRKCDVKSDHEGAGEQLEVKMHTDVKDEAGEQSEVIMEMDAKDADDEVATPMEEEAEDIVIREIDVFFSRSIEENSQVYVLQYPLRPNWRPYELEERCQEVRVKPLSSEIEVELSVDVESKNYDTDARGVRMTKQILSSAGKRPFRASYVIGVLINNKLHLNPVHAVVQLRPCMRHLDGSTKKKTPAGSTNPPKKQANPNQDEAVAAAESWVPLSYHSAGTEMSTRYLEKMVEGDRSPIQFSLGRDDYINSLCPCSSTKKAGLKSSLKSLSSLPLEKRIETRLREGGGACRYSVLKHTAPEETDEVVLGVLKQKGHLVQGVWVPKSKVLFEGGENKGVQLLARDYVLLLFSRSPTVKHSQVNNPKLSQLSRHMREVLRTLAVERPACRDWKFREPTDVSFIKAHPHVVSDQESLWQAFDSQVSTMINKGKPQQPQLPPKIPASRVPQMSAETRQALPKALMKLFQAHRVCTLRFICEGLRDLAVSEAALPKGDKRSAVAAALAADAPREELQAAVAQVAVAVHGSYVLKESDPFRNLVISMFATKPPNARFKKAEFIAASKLAKLGHDVTDAECSKVLKEICQSRGTVWLLKTGDGN